MSTINKTKTVDIDIYGFGAVCHVFYRNNASSYCGIPRREQAKHLGYAKTPKGFSTYCFGCGLKVCQKCDRLRSDPPMDNKVKELEKTMRCNCDLDNWEPEKNTGHSHVCRIHRAALGLPEKTRQLTPEQERYDDYVQSRRYQPDCCSCHINPPCGYCTRDIEE